MVCAVAYCWASGEIEIAAEAEDFELPEGVIPFARGEEGVLRSRLEVRARQAHDGQYLVPGLPEYQGQDDMEPVNILSLWAAWAFADWPVNDHLHTQPGIQGAVALIGGE